MSVTTKYGLLHYQLFFNVLMNKVATAEIQVKQTNSGLWNTVLTATAWCHPKDTFDDALGRRMALRRLYDGNKICRAVPKAVAESLMQGYFSYRTHVPKTQSDREEKNLTNPTSYWCRCTLPDNSPSTKGPSYVALSKIKQVNTETLQRLKMSAKERKSWTLHDVTVLHAIHDVLNDAGM